MVLAVSPDGRYIASVNAGYGTAESKYSQSIAVLDTQSGKLSDYPDNRTQVGANQTLYSGLTFSADGKHVYASMASLTDPVGDPSSSGRQIKTGSGIAVYGFDGTSLTQERILSIPLQPLAKGKFTRLISADGGHEGLPYPAGIALTHDAKGAEELLVADNQSDDVLLMDTTTGKILTRFDLSQGDVVPSTYPVAVTATADGSRAFVALWNASEVAELDLRNGTITSRLPLLKPLSPTATGSHPSAFAFSPDEKVLYVALSNRDAVAAVDISGKKFRQLGLFNTRLPRQTYFGAIPESVVTSKDGSHLYVADAGSDAVAVFNTKLMTAGRKTPVEPMGFVPTEWIPMALATSGDKLYIATGKGTGTGPNNFAPAAANGIKNRRLRMSFTYIGQLLHGSLASIEMSKIAPQLPEWTDEVLTSNRMKSADEKITFQGGGHPIKHVIYIIKENRTYDQVFGDLTQNGKPVGDGDPSLAMYGAKTTPNQHALALRFGVIDNFYDSGEVSGSGHVWSTAAIVSDYTEKTWQQSYRGKQHPYDWEGMVADGYPLLEKIPDVNEPASGYLWTDLAAHGKSYYHFGEYISTKYCGDGKARKADNPQAGPVVLQTAQCARSTINPGEEIPAIYGGGISKYNWSIPLMASNTATKPELVGHFSPDGPDWNVRFPDQLRLVGFLKKLDGWKADRKNGKDTMPDFIMLRLGNDHTGGTTPGGPAPKASVAENDLAVGRAVDAISHSDYWEDTAFFIIEDDAQNGADHVDAHRSTALVVSKYAPRQADGTAVVHHEFYSTVSILRSIENLLGLPPMNNNDAFASPYVTFVFGQGGPTGLQCRLCKS